MVLAHTCGLDIEDLEVCADRALGWAAHVKAAPSLIGGYQATVDRVVRDIRKDYDLENEYPRNAATFHRSRPHSK